MELNKLDLEQRFIDASKIKDLLRCPRYFFFRHVLGWTVDRPSKDLVYGEAWHKALATLYKCYKEASAWKSSFIDRAYQNAEEYYREYFSASDDLGNAPKSPGFLLRDLIIYFERHSAIDHFEVIDTEVKVAALVAENLKISGRLDLLYQTHGKINVLEHKTSGMLSSHWADQWQLSVQTATYNHCLRMLFADNAGHVVVNGYIVRKNDQEFLRVPVHMTLDAHVAYLQDVVSWNNYIQDACRAIVNEDYESGFPFRKNTEACFKWNRKCEFHPFCIAWQNPILECERTPIDFTVRFWEGGDNGDS